MHRSIVAALGVLALLAGSCGGGDGEGDTEAVAEDTTTTTTATSPAAGTVTVDVADSELGSILVDGEGRTLYVFTNDEPEMSTCTDDCAQNWPPLEAPEPPVAGDGVDEDLLGSISRDDGTEQVTYAGMPLYHFAADSGPGDTQGQGVGGVWFVVGADGEPITGAAADAADDPGYGAAPPATPGDDPEQAAPGAVEAATTGGGGAAAPPAETGSPSTTAAPPSTTTTTASTAPTTTEAAATAAIRIENFTYSPLALQVAPGTTVTATNADSASHTWTADDGSWESGTLGQGDAYQHTFTDPGTFGYYCAIHPSMKGTVSVS